LSPQGIGNRVVVGQVVRAMQVHARAAGLVQGPPADQLGCGYPRLSRWIVRIQARIEQQTDGGEAPRIEACPEFIEGSSK
jgi:hypothetical protein